MSTVIEYLVSDQKCDSSLIAEGLNKARNIYNRFNAYWKDNLLKALLLDKYRLEHDIEEGQIVTKGDLVGFAFDIDYQTRMFNLSSNKSRSDILASYNMDDFQKI